MLFRSKLIVSGQVIHIYFSGIFFFFGIEFNFEDVCQNSQFAILFHPPIETENDKNCIGLVKETVALVFISINLIKGFHPTEVVLKWRDIAP